MYSEHPSRLSNLIYPITPGTMFYIIFYSIFVNEGKGENETTREEPLF